MTENTASPETTTLDVVGIGNAIVDVITPVDEAFLTEHDLPLVCVDMPQGFDSSLPPLAAATSKDLAMVRFHGRDPKAWSAKSGTAAERFRYDYGERELEEWVPKIKALRDQARETHVVMNNCYENYAVKNARQLASLLD